MIRSSCMIPKIPTSKAIRICISCHGCPLVGISGSLNNNSSYFRYPLLASDDTSPASWLCHTKYYPLSKQAAWDCLLVASITGFVCVKLQRVIELEPVSLHIDHTEKMVDAFTLANMNWYQDEISCKYVDVMEHLACHCCALRRQVEKLPKGSWGAKDMPILVKIFVVLIALQLLVQALIALSEHLLSSKQYPKMMLLER